MTKNVEKYVMGHIYCDHGHILMYGFYTGCLREFSLSYQNSSKDMPYCHLVVNYICIIYIGSC